GERARFRNSHGSEPTAARGHGALNFTGGDDDPMLAVEDSGYSRVEAAHDLEVIMAKAPADIRRVLEVVKDTDVSMKSAASIPGINYSRLQRWLGTIRREAA